MTKQNIYRI